MAGTFRQIHTKIWKDPWFLDLPPDHKLLFIYLFSNEQANLMGLYQIALKVICFETDLDMDTVKQALAQFAQDGKVEYQDGYVWIVKMFRYNANNPKSPKTQEHIRRTLDALPNIPLKAKLIRYYSKIIPDIYPSDTPDIPVPHDHDHEQDQEHDQEQQRTADAAPNGAPATFEQWLALVQDPPNGSNRPAVLRHMFETLYPGRDPPDYGYIGAVARTVGGAGRLAELLWQNSTKPPTGDVLRYVQGVAKGQAKSNPRRRPASQVVQDWVEKEGIEWQQGDVSPGS